MLLAGRLKEVVLKTKRFSLQAAPFFKTRFFKAEAFFRFWGKCKALF
ncbi:hypothetical protein CLOLEP_01475 [[Clostridium] leptum DSM 753]|jgi:hypothetical protein|uniref:Uncharacterized protein n=1 Tax=[Clostridium] leptum DSM 753 TaxID=428125 RepID=A7VSD5_9FIRM|nr:hypothetical protein CLOLEP_01475 [[Clostridium] leptum DSM 753]